MAIGNTAGGAARPSEPLVALHGIFHEGGKDPFWLEGIFRLPRDRDAKIQIYPAQTGETTDFAAHGKSSLILRFLPDWLWAAILSVGFRLRRLLSWRSDLRWVRQLEKVERARDEAVTQEKLSWVKRSFRKRARLSARDVMAKVTDLASVNAGQGIETIEVALGHVVFMSGTGGACDPDTDPFAESRAASALMSQLDGHFDPQAGIRVACMASTALLPHEILMVLGRAVHVPKRGEKPVGWLRFYPDAADRNTFAEPVLRDGRPASFYLGQSGVAFGEVTDCLHANLDLRRDNRDPSLLFTILPSPRTSAADGIEAHLKIQSRRKYSPYVVKADHGNADWAWGIGFPEGRVVGDEIVKRYGRIELCVDDRPSRFFHRLQPKCNAAITGLRVDLAAFGGVIDRFWFDIDHGKSLKAYALQARKSSLVWDATKGEAYAYDWEGRSPAFAPPGSIQFKVHRPAPEIVEISRQDGVPLGYLSLPERQQPMVFADEDQSMSGFHVDWLDECGKVSINGRTVPFGLACAEAGIAATVSMTEVSAASRNSGTAFQAGPLLLKPL